MHTFTKREVSAAAWQEFKAARAAQGAAGEEMLAMPRPPGGFVAIELGFGPCEGPSLLATMQDLWAALSKGRLYLGDRSTVDPRDFGKVERRENVAAVPPPPPAPPKRESATDRAKRLDAMLRRSMRKHSSGDDDTIAKTMHRAAAARRAA